MTRWALLHRIQWHSVRRLAAPGQRFSRCSRCWNRRPLTSTTGQLVVSVVAGRTDAGVHAEGTGRACRSARHGYQGRRLVRDALNFHMKPLPSSRAGGRAEVADDWNARFSANQRGVPISYSESSESSRADARAASGTSPHPARCRRRCMPPPSVCLAGTIFLHSGLLPARQNPRSGRWTASTSTVPGDVIESP